MASNSRKKLWISLAVLAALVALAQFLDLPALLQRGLGAVESAGPRGIAWFALLYIASCVFFVPGSLLTLGAGAIFGLWKGFLIVSFSSTLGSAAAFLIGRTLARDWVASKAAGDPRFQALDQAVGREGWKIVLLTRLSPLFPFNLVNYLFGLTKVSFSRYFLSSWIGMMPGTLLYVYIGSLAGSLAKLEGSREKTPMEWAIYGTGLLATLAVSLYVTKIARRALDKGLASAGTAL
jgi:uncharacterized membrane protein YdjX (TVP38/TMEM64 family)